MEKIPPKNKRTTKVETKAKKKKTNLKKRKQHPKDTSNSGSSYDNNTLDNVKNLY